MPGGCRRRAGAALQGTQAAKGDTPRINVAGSLIEAPVKAPGGGPTVLTDGALQMTGCHDASGVRSIGCPVPINLLYLSTQLLWWQAVTAIIGGRSSHTLRHNARGTWRHSEGSRNVDTTAIRCAFSPLRPCGSSPADVHDCPRGVAPLRHRLAIKDTPGASTGEATTPSPPHPMGCAAHPSILFSPPGHGFSTLDAHWKPLI